MKIFKPSNKVGRFGLFWLTSSALVGGVVIGAISYFVSLYIYLVILFPLVMGLAAGAIMSAAVKKGKIRNPTLAGFFGTLTGFIIILTMQIGGYIQFQEYLAMRILQTQPEAKKEHLKVYIDYALQHEVGSTGFIGYLKFTAKQGISMARIGRTPTHIGETGTWLYWALELLVIQGIIATSAYLQAKKPFCETFGVWYKEPLIISYLNKDLHPNPIELVQNNRFLELGEMSHPLEIISYPCWEISIQTASEQSLPVISIKTFSFDKKKRIVRKNNLVGIISENNHHDLIRGVKNTSAKLQGKLSDSEFLKAVNLAKNERQKPISDYDSFQPCKLDLYTQSELKRKVAENKQIKEAFLVQKTLTYFPDVPLYILGIIRFINPFKSKANILKSVQENIQLPKYTQVVFLDNKKLLKAIKKTQPEPFYKARQHIS